MRNIETLGFKTVHPQINNPQNLSGRFLTTSEAGRILSLATKTVAAWAKAGRFPNAIKTSDKGEWRIPVSDIHRLIERPASEVRP